MSPIKDFNLTYEALNEEDTFSEGDTVTGTVTFTSTKNIKVKSLFVKVKGDANVHWEGGRAEDEGSYSAHRRFFKLKEYLVAENDKGSVIYQGFHCYKFRFNIPQGDMPSSFKGLHGKIVYMLEAKMSRSWRRTSGVQKELNFVTKSFPHPAMCPQSGSVDKEMGAFSKGKVQLSATVNRKVCSPGDTLSVVAKICNSSSKVMRPKFSLQQKTLYHANGSTKTSDKSLIKIVGDTIKLNSEETVSCQVKIPADVVYTLNNCEILSVDYYLKVYLDIKFAINPKVEFPLVIAPSSFATLSPGEAVGPYQAGAPGYSHFPPPAFPVGPYPVPAGPGAYGYLAPDPTQLANATSGYNSQWPQQATLYGTTYGFPTAAFPSSSVQYQAPTAPLLTRTYSSLFPTFLSRYFR